MRLLARADARAIPLADQSVHCVVTSPPYYNQRDYGYAEQLGQEPTPGEYVEVLAQTCDEVLRVLRDDGTFWLNLGDSYATRPNTGTGWASSQLTKPNGRARKVQVAQLASTRRKGFDVRHGNLLGIPYRVAFALQERGWLWRAECIWHKTNGMPHPAGRRRPHRAHEHVLLFAKTMAHYYDWQSVAHERTDPRERIGHSVRPGVDVKGGNQGRGEITNPDLACMRSVWSIGTEGRPNIPHYAPMPERLAEPCVLAGCPENGIVLDPFAGTATTVRVANRLGRRGVGLDLSAEYLQLAAKRTTRVQRQFA